MGRVSLAGQTVSPLTLLYTQTHCKEEAEKKKKKKRGKIVWCK